MTSRSFLGEESQLALLFQCSFVVGESKKGNSKFGFRVLYFLRGAAVAGDLFTKQINPRFQAANVFSHSAIHLVPASLCVLLGLMLAGRAESCPAHQSCWPISKPRIVFSR